ncbi:MAG: hypothetical protein ACOWWO_08340 [Peptococcaceae bacterium]
MILCIDPGSKYVGYAIVKHDLIIAKGSLLVLQHNIFQELDRISADYPEIHTVLIEKGATKLRDYEISILAKLQEHNYRNYIYLAKDVRKKLKLERHPNSLGIQAKKELIHKNFPDLVMQDTSIHELDCLLLYLFYKKYTLFSAS